MKHIASTDHKDICLVFYIKDHHLYPIQDNRLKYIATQANQGGARTYGTTCQNSNGLINRVII